MAWDEQLARDLRAQRHVEWCPSLEWDPVPTDYGFRRQGRSLDRHGVGGLARDEHVRARGPELGNPIPDRDADGVGELVEAAVYERDARTQTRKRAVFGHASHGGVA